MSNKILCINMCLVPPLMSSTHCCKSRINLLFETYANNYEILLLNEVWDFMLSCKCNSRLDYLLEKAREYNFVFNYHVPRTTWQLCNNGLVILSKHKILETKNLIFNNTAGLQTIVNNGAILAKINLNNNIINVIVTHLHAGPFDSRFMNSYDTYLRVVRNQVVELYKFIKENIKQDEKYIIAGDFNIDDKDKESLAHLEKHLGESLMRSLGFPNTYPTPINGDSPLVDPKFINKPSCIDHCFSKNIEESKIKVTILELCVNNKYLSDHAGLEIIV